MNWQKKKTGENQQAVEIIDPIRDIMQARHLLTERSWQVVAVRVQFNSLLYIYVSHFPEARPRSIRTGLLFTVKTVRLLRRHRPGGWPGATPLSWVVSWQNVGFPLTGGRSYCLDGASEHHITRAFSRRAGRDDIFCK